MRTQEHWDKFTFPKLLRQLPPRIQKDLVELPPIKKMPEYGSYYIHGPAEVGKTILAARLWIDARKHFYFDRLPGRTLFISVPDFLLELKATYNDDEKDEAAVLAKYAEATYLVLDDLGAERTTEWMSTLLYTLINRRYENMLTTVITSNYTLDELALKLNDVRIPSRIKRMCKVIQPKR